MRVHHLNCGTMRPLGGWLMDGRLRPRLRGELVNHCLLIETADTLVLVDTGFGTTAHTRGDHWLGREFMFVAGPDVSAAATAVEQIRALGYDPGDVGHIVLTHLDFDHTGGLVDFPTATVHLHAAELAAMRRPHTRVEMARYRRRHIAHGPRWREYSEAGDSFFGFDAVRQLDGLPPDILLIPLIGHSRGHSGVAVRTGNRWLFDAGDAYDARGEVHPGAHGAGPAMAALHGYLQVHDRTARFDNMRRLRELAAAHGDEVTVFSAHCPDDFAHLHKKETHR